jgi:pyroglutamyl-peptidase
MAGTTGEYEVERQGHRDGYHFHRKTGEERRDVDGKTLRECEREMGLKEGEYWRECPKVLRTTLDVDDVLKRMRQLGPNGKSRLPEGATVKDSDDAGNYLCDFIYYSSLSHFWRKGDGKRPVVFLHVPPESDEEVLSRGREVTKGLIRAIVASGGATHGD